MSDAAVLDIARLRRSCYRTLGHFEGQLVLPMSREDIPSYLGLVIETVRRSFSRLQHDGLIEVHGRQVQVLDATRFAALARETLVAGRNTPRH